MFRVVLLTEKGQVTCKTRMPIEDIRAMLFGIPTGWVEWIKLDCLDDMDELCEVRIQRAKTFGAIILSWRASTPKQSLVQPMIQ